MKQQLPATLAQRLGISAPVSPLLMKIRRLSQGRSLVPWLIAMANDRGYTAVQGTVAAPGPAMSGSLSNEELATAFLLPAMPDEPQSLRLAAQMISRAEVNVSALFRLAEREGVLRLLSGLAQEALKVSPVHEVWLALANATGQQKPLRDRLIHWTRLAEPIMRPRGPHSGEWRLVA